MSIYVLAYDAGTTGLKTCLFRISKNNIQLKASASSGYSLSVLESGGVEQDPEEWWQAMCLTTRQVLHQAAISKEEISGISFCAQMQAVVLVDENGDPVRKAMNYMDTRGTEEFHNGIGSGPKIAGLNAYKLWRSIRVSRAVSASVKDPVWKYNWIKFHEPEVFERVFKWLDVKDFLVCRSTGRFVMSEDSAYATLLMDTRKGKKCFSKELCRLMGVYPGHLPDICGSAEQAGALTSKAAEALGLQAGTPVFAGGGDASLIGVGAGAVLVGDAHIYMGTSGWVSAVSDKQLLDIRSMIASIVGANPNTYHFFAELETAGKCLEWVKDHLALDEIDLYLEKKPVYGDQESVHKSLYDYMMFCIKDVPPGSNGVIFTPWLHGNRCPFEDPNARGMFFNIGLETGKTELIRSVLEGVCYHLKWQLDSIEKTLKTAPVIRLVGGGALAPLTCQILSDILNRKIETVENPQNAGAVGAAVVAAVGLGLIEKIEEAKDLISVSERFTPNKNNAAVYENAFQVFKTLYKNNAVAFRALNQKESSFRQS